jgi:hypothetical protein
MTDRHTGYLVTLETDIREDDAQRIIEALLMVRGVLGVESVTSDPLVQAIAYQRRDTAWINALAETCDKVRKL